MTARSGRLAGRLPLSLAILACCAIVGCTGWPLPAAAAATIDDSSAPGWRPTCGRRPRRQASRRKTFDAAFAGVTPNLKLPDLVLPGEKPKTPKTQHQAEFGSPGAYFAEKTIGAVGAGGRARATAYAERRSQPIEKRYGVPGAIVLAIWGRETGFGAAEDSLRRLRGAGTKAFMATRKEMFRKELLAALEIVQRGHVEPGTDEDRPGPARSASRSSCRRSYLEARRRFRRRRQRRHLEFGARHAGLDRQLPGRLWLGAGPRLGLRGDRARTSVSCALEGPDRGKTISDWAALGIARVSGKPFPAARGDAPRDSC